MVDRRRRFAIAFIESDVRTQDRLAYLTGYDRGTISRIVNGWRHPSPEQAARIASALNTPVNELFPDREAVAP